ncbi:hypothetical protein C0Q70_04346 [Pomacea canaliculata]|uniref:Thyroglobulin type-1 domain-containing protein n=1 Tax=Pomacea canaliculata TaxID=400727 RepID=A0A2T7PVE2_POMCA|nr:hypothetical protein C0Q70_04346 [Pomacea canaliculata]
MLVNILVLSLAVTLTHAIACTPGVCSLVRCAAVTEDNCDGRVARNGGFCGCCDLCVRQLNKGESCIEAFLLGLSMPASSECGAGLTYPQTCQERLQQLQSGVHLLGQFLPTCAQDGTYAARQCHGSVCYCVDPSGVKIADYSASIGQSADMNCHGAHRQDVLVRGQRQLPEVRVHRLRVLLHRLTGPTVGRLAHRQHRRLGHPQLLGGATLPSLEYPGLMKGKWSQTNIPATRVEIDSGDQATDKATECGDPDTRCAVVITTIEDVPLDFRCPDGYECDHVTLTCQEVTAVGKRQARRNSFVPDTGVDLVTLLSPHSQRNQQLTASQCYCVDERGTTIKGYTSPIEEATNMGCAGKAKLLDDVAAPVSCTSQLHQKQKTGNEELKNSLIIA